MEKTREVKQNNSNKNSKQTDIKNTKGNKAKMLQQIKRKS